MAVEGARCKHCRFDVLRNFMDDKANEFKGLEKVKSTRDMIDTLFRIIRRFKKEKQELRELAKCCCRMEKHLDEMKGE